MIYLYNHRDTYPKDKIIDVTSRSKTWSRGLSPFLLGPVELYDGYSSKNMENAWQYCKVYTQHIDVYGYPTDAYFEWAYEGWNKQSADRYPMGKGIKPQYSYWAGKRLTYVEARKQIYIPLYATAVRDTKAFAQLKAHYETFGEVHLLDFDIYRHDIYGVTLKEAANDPNKKFGHGFVLALLLYNQINENNGYIIER